MDAGFERGGSISGSQSGPQLDTRAIVPPKAASVSPWKVEAGLGREQQKCKGCCRGVRDWHSNKDRHVGLVSREGMRGPESNVGTELFHTWPPYSHWTPSGHLDVRR